MKRISAVGIITIIIVVCVVLLCACSGDSNPLDDFRKGITGGAKPSVDVDPNAPDRDNTPKVMLTEDTGKNTFEGKGTIVDYSNANRGYFMVKYAGDNQKVKVLVRFGDEDPYAYDLQPGGFNSFPLSQGSGNYTIGVYENIEGERYVPVAEKTIKASIKDKLMPFLYPNQYSNFNDKSACVEKASQICAGAKSDLGATEKIFLYIVENVSYDFNKAATVQSGYIPDPDATLASNLGICFDYASLTTSMLRSQGIPCQLIVGYAGTAYHAWIAAYSIESGKVANIIQFQADAFNLMDPTFTSSGDKADPNMVGDGTSYNPIFYY